MELCLNTAKTSGKFPCLADMNSVMDLQEFGEDYVDYPGGNPYDLVYKYIYEYIDREYSFVDIVFQKEMPEVDMREVFTTELYYKSKQG